MIGEWERCAKFPPRLRGLEKSLGCGSYGVLPGTGKKMQRHNFKNTNRELLQTRQNIDRKFASCTFGNVSVGVRWPFFCLLSSAVEVC